MTFIEEESAPIIKVIGVGGGGSNAVNNMWNKGIKDVEFAICNTDQQALRSSPVPEKISIGTLGAGGKPEVAAAKAREHIEEIKESCTGKTRMVFLAACMGGGTGTGASPIIAEAIKEIQTNYEETKDILIVAIVTMPFAFEGPKRINNAKAGIAELKKYADSVIVINNEKLLTCGSQPMPLLFKLADEILLTATKSIAELITNNQYINIDFQDVYSIMSGSKTALMGRGVGEGENRAEMAITAAASSPLLNDQDIHNAKGCLLNITCSSEHAITVEEFSLITSYVNREILDSENPDSNVIWGTGYDDSLGEKLVVTLVATGFNRAEDEIYTKPIQKKEEVTKKEEQVIPLDPMPVKEEPKENIPEPIEQPISNKTDQPIDEIPPFEVIEKKEPTPAPVVNDNTIVVIDIDDDEVSLKTKTEEPKAEVDQPEPQDDEFKVINVATTDGTNTINEPSVKPEPKTPATTPQMTDNDVTKRMERARQLRDLLKSGIDGVTKVANMDLVHGDAFQATPSNVSDATNSIMSADGIIGNNPLLYGNPD